MRDVPIFSLSPQAAARIKALIAKAPSNPLPPTGVRVGVKKRGCSGYSYTMNYAYPAPHDPAARPDDYHVKDAASGVEAVVAKSVLFYVIGTRMDYTWSNVEEKFVFSNPNEKIKCGCGESFLAADEN